MPQKRQTHSSAQKEQVITQEDIVDDLPGICNLLIYINQCLSFILNFNNILTFSLR